MFENNCAPDVLPMFASIFVGGREELYDLIFYCHLVTDARRNVSNILRSIRGHDNNKITGYFSSDIKRVFHRSISMYKLCQRSVV